MAALLFGLSAPIPLGLVAVPVKRSAGINELASTEAEELQPSSAKRRLVYLMGQ